MTIGWQLFKKKTKHNEYITQGIKPIDLEMKNEINEQIEKSKDHQPKGFVEKLEYKLEGTGLSLQAYLIRCLLFAVIGFLVGKVLFNSGVFGFGLAVFGWILPKLQLERARAKKLEQFNLNFRNTLLRMASMIRAGGSVKQSILDVATSNDSNPIIRAEFKRAHTDMEYGYTIEEAFYRMFERTGSEDVKMVSRVTEIQRQKGGNLAELLDSIQHTITERHNQKKRMETLTAQQRSQANLLSMIPGFVYLFFWFYNPEYYKTFLDSFLGISITLGCVIMILMGRFIMTKMATPK